MLRRIHSSLFPAEYIRVRVESRTPNIKKGIKMHYDPDAKMDIDALTEMFDNEQYSEVGAIGRRVFELLLELVLSSEHALELTDGVKYNAFRSAHEWGLDGAAAEKSIIKIARETAKAEIIRTTSIAIEVRPDTDTALWASVIAESGLDLMEKKVVLLSTANLIYDQGQNEARLPEIARPLEPKEIADALNKSVREVETVIAKAAEKIKASLSKQILTGGN